METGHLRDSGVVSSLTCTECGEAHDAELTIREEEYGYFCPDLGFVGVSRQEVEAVAPDLSFLVEALADAFSCKRRKTSAIHGATWRIGAIQTALGDVMLYFHPNLRDETDLRSLGDALSREVRSSWRLIVSADGALSVEGATTVNLHELVELDESDGALVPLSDPCALVGVPRRNPGGAPNRYGSLLIGLINERIVTESALSGRNEEAKAILALFVQQNPGALPPSLSSVKDYVSRVRAGQ